VTSVGFVMLINADSATWPSRATAKLEPPDPLQPICAGRRRRWSD